jgi:zinc transporter 1/2/3
MDSLLGNKVAAFFIIFFVTLFFGLLPSCVVKCLQGSFIRGKIHSVISHLNCFAGGVFLGTAMLHLLAESEEGMREALAARNSTIHYPVTEVAVSGGFFVILILEIVLLRIMHGVGHGPGEKYDSSQKIKHGYDSLEGRDNMAADVQEVEDHLSASGVHDDVREAIKQAPSPLRASLFVLALSLHMIFEALAVGLQETELQVWSLLLAISLHKCIVAFSVGLEMRLILETGCKMAAFLLVFSVISSIGVLIGMFITEGGTGQSLTIGLLQSLATGTFFYVTFFEILQREFSHCHSIIKLFLCLLGYSVIAGLKTLDKD